MRLAIRLLIAGIGLIVLGAKMLSSGTYKPEDHMTWPTVSIVAAGALSTGLGAYLLVRLARGRAGSSRDWEPGRLD
jgi:hypothetical protein